MTTTSTARQTTGLKPVTAGDFLARMTKLVRARRAAAAAAFFEQHAPAVLDDLTLSERLQLDELMEYVDTVTGWQPPRETRSVAVSAEPLR
jgi:hypothetical protein